MGLFDHRPVLTGELLKCLAPRPGGVYVDCTVGGGGHAAAILEAAGPDSRLIGIDRDADAIEAARGSLERFGRRVQLVRENFKAVAAVVAEHAPGGVDGIVMDLGVSSYQLDSAERGFSFRADGPLDMRMDKRGATTAADLVNGLPEEELARVFTEYGEERFAARIAAAIVRQRAAGPIETTGRLKGVVLDAVPGKFHGGPVHPATRVFQALRIAVNGELDGLKAALPGAFASLKPGGRLAVISFHSLEDKMVKEYFRSLTSPCVCPPRIPVCACGRAPEARAVTKGAVKGSPAEVEGNPRARSARLRAVERV